MSEQYCTTKGTFKGAIMLDPDHSYRKKVGK